MNAPPSIAPGSSPAPSRPGARAPGVSRASLALSVLLLGFLSFRAVLAAAGLPAMLWFASLNAALNLPLEQRVRAALEQAPAAGASREALWEMYELLDASTEPDSVLFTRLPGKEGRVQTKELQTLLFPRLVSRTGSDEELQRMAGRTTHLPTYVLLAPPGQGGTWQSAATRVRSTAHFELWRLEDER